MKLDKRKTWPEDHEAILDLETHANGSRIAVLFERTATCINL